MLCEGQKWLWQLPQQGNKHVSVVSSRSSSVAAPQAEPLKAQAGGIDLIEFINGTFSTYSFNGTWISGELPHRGYHVRPVAIRQYDT